MACGLVASPRFDQYQVVPTVRMDQIETDGPAGVGAWESRFDVPYWATKREAALSRLSATPGAALRVP